MICDSAPMRGWAALFLVLVLTVPAMAAPPAKPAEPGTHVEMPFLIAPMNADGKLQGYAYISSKLVASSPAASVEIREKLAFIQDAFVRAVNAGPVNKSADPTSVDTAVLAQRLIAEARRIVGASSVASIVFTRIQFAPIHPSPTTEGTVPPPASQSTAPAQAATAPQAAPGAAPPKP